MAERVTIQVRLSAEARERLHAFCFERGISLTTFVEALSDHLGSGELNVEQMVAEARRIDAERRTKRWR